MATTLGIQTVRHPAFTDVEEVADRNPASSAFRAATISETTRYPLADGGEAGGRIVPKCSEQADWRA